MTNTEHTPPTAAELNAMEARHDSQKWFNVIDPDMPDYERETAKQLFYTDFPRLLAEAREAKRLRGEVGRLTKDYATLQYVKDEIVRTQPQYIKDLQALNQEQSQTIDQLTARVDELEGQLKRWQPPNDSKSFSQADSQGEGG